MIQEIWNELSKVPIDKKDLEQKGRFTYLPWNYAIDYIMRKTPDLKEFSYEFLEYKDNNGVVRDYIMSPDGSCQVECQVILNGIKSSKMWLAVTDHNNKPIKNPNCNDIAHTKMRCLTKCIATNFGLGFYIYKGQIFPYEHRTENQAKEFDELKKKPAFDGKRKAIKEEWSICQNQKEYESVLRRMRATIKKHEDEQAEAINQDIDNDMERKINGN